MSSAQKIARERYSLLGRIIACQGNIKEMLDRHIECLTLNEVQYLGVALEHLEHIVTHKTKPQWKQRTMEMTTRA